MKSLRLPLMFAFLFSLFTGCASPQKGPPALLIAPLLDRVVPSDWKGDGEFAERGHYLVIEIKAQGLEKTERGWTWKALEYRRTLSLPIFAGAAYKHEGWVKLSPPK